MSRGGTFFGINLFNDPAGLVGEFLTLSPCGPALGRKMTPILLPVDLPFRQRKLIRAAQYHVTRMCRGRRR